MAEKLWSHFTAEGAAVQLLSPAVPVACLTPLPCSSTSTRDDLSEVRNLRGERYKVCDPRKSRSRSSRLRKLRES